MTTATLKEVKPNPKNDAQGFAVFDDGVEAWTPEKAKAEALIGKPLPSDWTLKDGPYGKQLLPPKEGGRGGVAWKNTKEGVEFEQANWRHKSEYEAERSDRRTALMQAVQFVASRVSIGSLNETLDVADDFYDWLRATSGEAGSGARAPASSGNSSGEVAAATRSPDPAASPDPSRSPEPEDGEASATGEREGVPGEELSAGSEPSSGAPSTDAMHIHVPGPSEKLSTHEVCTVPGCMKVRRKGTEKWT